jgi:voltage-gated potassium channel
MRLTRPRPVDDEQCRPVAADVAQALVDLPLRGCLARQPTEREIVAQRLYERLHPFMAGLAILFVVVVLGQLAAHGGSPLHGVLMATTWVLWAVFVAEYVLRLVIAPVTLRFLRRTWWQALFLLIPFLSFLRIVLFFRVARGTRVVTAAIRGTRSSARKLTNRLAWLALVTLVVVFSTADLVYEYGEIRPYGVALHGAAKAAIAAEAMPGTRGIVQLLDVLVGAYSIAVFAAVAGAVGAFLLERRDEHRELVGGIRQNFSSSSNSDMPIHK